MNEFLFTQNWFYQKYFLNLEQGHRFWTMYTALSLFLQLGGKNMVETGCLRMKDDWGAGMSTLVFADFASQYKKSLWSVDINDKNLSIAANITKDYKDNVKMVTGDSISFLKDCFFPIDFLYLDSLDFDFNKPEPSQDHCLSELEAAYSVLSRKAVVLMDDNLLPGGGKPAKAKLWLQGLGWKCIMDYHQTLWVREL